VSETKRSPLESGQAAESIAIVGIGCRYADARGPEEFWEIVRSGRNTVRDAPQHRIELGYDIDHFYDPRPRIPGKISSKKGGFLEHPELFDPAPFGIAPRDALTMEPQQRLMVEVTWDALEDAGIVPAEIAGERVAVMLGYMAEDYSRERTGVLGEEAVFRGHDVFTVGGMSHAVLSGRIAFLLGVTGPSFTLDTACSSSLIATHLACQSLLRGESNLALAGGANLFLSPEGNIALSRSGMLSMSGACKAFDASADGFVRAEGAGVVVLKRLSDALRDHDPIYAVIRGSGISTDGRDGGHMMAPGRKGQAQAMRDAYAQAGVDPADVQYVETHGTGTTIGDPVEIGALADVMGPGRDPERPLLVASVKGNLGHTESASGVAGLIKACLAIRHRTLPAQLHFETPNPMIPWDEIPVRVQSETTPWPYEGQALVGVNSYAISGTNAHVVLEGPPERPARDDASVLSSTVEESPRPCLLTITAHDSNALHDMVEATRQRLEGCDQEGLEDLAYTFARHRSQRAHRLSVSARSVEAMRGELDGYLAGEASAAIQTGIAASENAPKIVMVFPGGNRLC
jgi:acyl transferase domain-containing protein